MKTLKTVLKSYGIGIGLRCDNTLKSHIVVATGQQLLALFPPNMVGILGVQRNDEARLKTTKASHILSLRGRPDTQSEFRAIWFEGKLFILDGNHRIRAWHEQPHLVMANVCLRIYEPTSYQQIEELYASIDSRKSAKGSQDDLWSIFNFAGISRDLKSEEMLTGKKLATVMKHFLPGNSGIIARAQVAKRKAEVLKLVDKLFLDMPQGGIHKVSEFFGGGELLAIMELAQSFVDAKDRAGFRIFSMMLRSEFLAYIQYAINGSRGLGAAPKLVTVFEMYEKVATQRGHKRTGEKVVVARAAILKPLLEAHLEPQLKAARRARAKSAV